MRTALLGRLSSLYALMVGATFVPFLVFFMLAGKRQVWHATMQLFPAGERTNVKETLTEVALVLRSFLVGTALVGLILVAATWLFFWFLGLDFPFLTALASGLCNMVPYLGTVFSWIPPLLVGLTKYHSAGPYIGIFSMLTVFHLVCRELSDSHADRLAYAIERARAHRIIALLGMALGSDGIHSRDSDHGGH